jgi:hypothetical protein
VILSWTSRALTRRSRISAASCALVASFAARIRLSRSSRLSTVPERSARRNLEGASSGKTSEISISAPSGSSRRRSLYATATTAVAVRLIASHQRRKIQSELVGTPVIDVATWTKPREPATGSA